MPIPHSRILKMARHIIERPGGWCRGTDVEYRRCNHGGQPTGGLRYCARGAVIAATDHFIRAKLVPLMPSGGAANYPALQLLDGAAAPESIDGGGIVAFNDRQNEVGPVLAMFDKAIMLAQATEAAADYTPSIAIPLSSNPPPFALPETTFQEEIKVTFAKPATYVKADLIEV